MVQPTVRFAHVSKRFGTVTALDDVVLEVFPGELLALIGESGSGKTTLLTSVNRLIDVDHGVVVFEGDDVAALDPVQLRRRVGYVPQDGGLLPHWPVDRNVGLVPWLRDVKDRTQRVTRALDLVGLPAGEYGHRWPAELSGGQRQRVAVARALAAEPDLILLDEPFGALDAITRNTLRGAFDSLRRELELTAILVTHDITEALALGDRIGVMRSGRLEQIAAPNDLLAAPATAYVADLLSQAGVRS